MCWRSSRLSLPSRQPWLVRFMSVGCVLVAAETVLLSMVHHDPADSLAVGRRLELGGDPAARHDADAIREIEHLIEVIADQQDGGAAGARFQKALVHRRAGAHVETAAWTMRHDDFRVAAEFPRDDQLLRVAAGEQSRALPQGANALHVE